MPFAPEKLLDYVEQHRSRLVEITRELAPHAQEWDYFHGISAVKRMQSMYHGTLVAQGAFSLYNKRALKSVGGWPHSVHWRSRKSRQCSRLR